MTDTTHHWYPGASGTRVHAVRVGDPIVHGAVATACSPNRPLQISRDPTADAPPCGQCVRRLAAPKHGTYAGFGYHHKRGEKPCQPCQEAAATYQRKRRQTNPSLMAVERARDRVRGRALWRLAGEFPERFRELLAEESAKERTRAT